MLQTVLAKIRADNNLSDLLRHSGTLYAGGLLSLGLTFVQQITTANLLGAENYGRLAVILSSGLLVMLVMDFRTWELATKLLARPLADHMHDEAVRVITWLLLVEVVTGIVGLGALLLLAQPLAALLLRDSTFDMLIQLYAVSIPFRIIAQGVISTLPRLYDRFDWLAFKSVTYAALRLAFMSGTALLGWGLPGVVFGAMLGELANALILLIMAWRLRQQHMAETPLFNLTKPAQYQEGRRLLGDMWITSTLAGLHYQTFVPMMALLTSPGQIGLFRSGMDIAELIEKTIQPLSIVFSPKIMRLYEQGQRTDFLRFLKQSALILLAITTPLTFGLLIAVPFVLPKLLPAPEYAGLITVTTILIVGYGIHTALQWWIRPALVVTGLVRLSNLTMFTLILVSIVVLLLTVPAHGAVGGGVAKAGFLASYALFSLVQLGMRLRRVTLFSRNTDEFITRIG